MDLLDRYRGGLSSRRLAVLIRHLPRDSAVNRDLFGEAADWSVGDHLLAAAVDHLAAANWMFATVNSDEDSSPPDPPQPVPRPADTRPDGTATADGAAPETAAEQPSAVELLRFFG
ncbi:hypothetical protein [Actinacidiphila yeochonensis]|uniref:hypothetical protein n=1 Tax=Actinacidiphila yeochonensis TaxID=89050 RepID=UPI00056C2282|nr:hypothetical protein [Actinacidiphila yeochonensis]